MPILSLINIKFKVPKYHQGLMGAKFVVRKNAQGKIFARRV